MKKYSEEELKIILEKHKKLLNDEEGGERADLNGADLSRANLIGADLSFADLSFTNLRGSDLSRADLSRANLDGADLYGADLSGSDLRGANLSRAKTDKRYITISCIGSRKDTTTYCFEDDYILCGCFKGTLEQFEDKVKTTHAPDTVYYKEYIGAIAYIKSLKEAEDERL